MRKGQGKKEGTACFFALLSRRKETTVALKNRSDVCSFSFGEFIIGIGTSYC